MTHPLTPHEKVRQIVDCALNSAIPEPWEVANHATDAILTALASGSGDHAELAKRLRSSKRERHGIYGRVLVNPDGPAAAASLEALLAEIAALRAACAKSNDEICQSLGKALGYPWFKDDQINFPGATAENGVCVGDHVAESLADEAARRLTEAERKLAEAVATLELAAIRFDEIYEAAEVDDVAYRNEATIHGINGLADVAQAEIRTFLSKEAERG